MAEEGGSGMVTPDTGNLFPRRPLENCPSQVPCGGPSFLRVERASKAPAVRQCRIRCQTRERCSSYETPMVCFRHALSPVRDSWHRLPDASSALRRRGERGRQHAADHQEPWLPARQIRDHETGRTWRRAARRYGLARMGVRLPLHPVVRLISGDGNDSERIPRPGKGADHWGNACSRSDLHWAVHLLLPIHARRHSHPLPVAAEAHGVDAAGVWQFPIFFIVLYYRLFDRWFFTEDDERRFEEIVATERRRSGGDF